MVIFGLTKSHAGISTKNGIDSGIEAEKRKKTLQEVTNVIYLHQFSRPDRHGDLVSSAHEA